MYFHLDKLSALALAPLVAAAFTSLPAPAQELAAPAWHRLGGPELGAHAKSALDQLNASAARAFRVEPSAVTGAARVLWGGYVLPPDLDVERAALAFLRQHASVFALPDGFATSTIVRGELEPRVYVSFAWAGIPVEGLSAIVLFGASGAIERVVAEVPASTEIVGSFDLLDAQVRAASEAALASYRGRTGRTRATTWRAPRMTQVYRAGAGGLRAAWRAEITATDRAESYATYVDAHDGTSLRTLERIVTASGKYPFLGQFVSFNTATARGNVYADQDDALDEKKSKQDLKGWSKGIGQPVNFPKGFLVGERSDVWDANSQFVFDEQGKYFFNPLNGQADAFDQVNIYFQLETFYKHLVKSFGTNLGSNFAIPVLVNVPSTELNAFFSPSLFEEGGHTEGFMSFFDLSQAVGTSAADVARDPTVAHHEYTHCWVHFEGESFDGEQNFPTRALGEAVADFYAATFAKDTVVGRYVGKHILGTDFLRNLQDDDHFPETVIDAMTQTASGLPEEHRSAEVFGSLLTDLRLEIADSSAEKIVFKALPLMPNEMDGVDASNALEATAAYFAQCAFALLESSGSASNDAAIIGAATGRGVLGNPSSLSASIMDLEPLDKRKVAFPSRFVVSSDQIYGFKAKKGRKLTVTMNAKSGSDVRPNFSILAFEDTGGAPVIKEHKPKVFSSGGHKVSQKEIELLLPTGSIYLIQVKTLPGELGRYTLTLDA